MVRTLSVLAGVALAAGAAHGAFLGVQLQTNNSWNSAATTAINDGNQYRVVRMFAVFSAADTVLSVGHNVATSGRFQLFQNSSAFYQSNFGNNFSPNSGLFGVAPALQWDTFVSVGRLTNDAGDATSADPQFSFADQLPGTGQDTVNGGWFNSNPPSLQGQAQSIGGGQFATFLGQFTVRGQAVAPTTSTIGTSIVNETFFGNLVVFQQVPGGGTMEHVVQFVGVPAPGGVAVMGLVGLCAARRRRA
jgi:hypothetical protein